MKMRLYDMYEYPDIVLSKDNRIGECETIEEAREIAVNYDLSCDGECDIWICPFNPEVNKFLCLDAEPFRY